MPLCQDLYGGAVHAWESTLHLTNIDVVSCTAGLGGGGIHHFIEASTGGGITIAGATFTNCTAVGDYANQYPGGGGVTLYGSMAVINDTVFDRCQTTGGHSNGGAILALGNSDLSIGTSAFQSCSAAKGGGGLGVGAILIASAPSRAFPNVFASTFDGCTAGQEGGAIVIYPESELTGTALEMRGSSPQDLFIREQEGAYASGTYESSSSCPIGSHGDCATATGGGGDAVDGWNTYDGGGESTPFYVNCANPCVVCEVGWWGCRVVMLLVLLAVFLCHMVANGFRSRYYTTTHTQPHHHATLPY